MPHTGCTPSLSTLPPAPGARVRRLAPVLALALAAALGCRDGAESPTDPEPGAALALESAQALSFRQVSAGDFHSCGVTSDNRAFCWGQNHAGQLGDGTSGNDSTPVAVAGGLRFLQVSAGVSYTCGVTTDNRAYCWGENAFGKLGNGTTTASPKPVAVAGGHRFRQVSAGSLHTCGVTTSDVAFCWGINRYGQLGDSSTFKRRLRPVQVAGGLRFRRASAGGIQDRGHSCGVTFDDRGYCWGYGGDGQLGDGKTFQRRTPRLVAGGLRFRQVLPGGAHSGAFASHSCGVTTDDRAYCWGSNDRGQLGDGTTTTRLKPVAVAGGLRFSGVSPGYDHTCGVTTGSAGYCWGYNYFGQLGDGSPLGDGEHLSPVAVAGGLQLRAVSTGQAHSCGVTTDNRAYCWGADNAGQLGDGSSKTTSTPVAVVGPM
jgi:alpha-tubulin suppressor-like RCC1 family protein